MFLDHREDAELKFGSTRVYDIAPVHLEITNHFPAAWGERHCVQGEIIGATWLDLIGMKSFTYAVGGETVPELVLERIVACGLLEGIGIALSRSACRDLGECELSPSSVNLEFVELIGISDYPVDPIRRSYQIPHPQVWIRTHLARRRLPALFDP